MLQKIFYNKWAKLLVFLACLIPLGLLVWKGFHADLTANPVEKVEHTTGDWTIYFLLITLSITPLRKLVPRLNLIRFRRMLGLYAFFYGCLHLLTYAIFDQSFNWMSILMDVAKRPFITVGFFGFVLMIPLAVTSTAGMIRRLGGKRWTMLHRLIYITATAGVVHYYWQVKSDVRLPVLYGAILSFLLICRIALWAQSRQAKKASARTAAPRREPSPAV
jgi:methionine sulfoxide reductase heme-binding subunit